MTSSSPIERATPEAVEAARTARDAHLREIVRHHFDERTGTPFWLEFAKQRGLDPVRDVRTFDDLALFPHFDDEWLRTVPPEQWIPRSHAHRPFKVFETGGTTGMPKQRLSWDDHLDDYTAFSDTLPEHAFPRGAAWLMVGPTGPRRLRLSIEHLANLRGGPCYFTDLDPRWVKKVIAAKQPEVAKQYLAHVVEQAVTILEGRKISCLFTTPKVLEALGDKVDLPALGIRGVFCGGTSMTKQVVRFLVEEVLHDDALFVPTYGNTLMGLACNEPISAATGFALTYHAPQPRAVLRVVNPDDTSKTVAYGEWGRVELTTLTREFFMPRFLERDEAIRREPWARMPWDGVGEVRPFRAIAENVVEGVY